MTLRDSIKRVSIDHRDPYISVPKEPSRCSDAVTAFVEVSSEGVEAAKGTATGAPVYPRLQNSIPTEL